MDNNLEQKKKLENEINDIWENQIKNNFMQEINSHANSLYQNIEKQLKMHEEKMNENFEDYLDLLQAEKIKSKMNKFCNNLIYTNITNHLINAILICLSNIEPFVFYCLVKEKSDISKKVNEKNKNNFFVLFIELFKNLWLVNNKKYNPEKFHKLISFLNEQISKSSDPGIIINFILSNLNNELNFNENQINDNNNVNRYSRDEVKKNFLGKIKNNETKISDIFFVSYKKTKTCKTFKEGIKYYYEQKPVMNLYIIKEKTIIKLKKDIKNDINDCFQILKLKETLPHLLNKNEDEEEYCTLCERKEKMKVNKEISCFNDNILIINFNRSEDPLHERIVEFPNHLNFNFKDDKNENENIKISFELISVLNKITIKELDYDKIHYNVYCKSFSDNKWYKYDENNEKVLSDEKEIFDGQKALLLIYKRK